MKTCQSCANDDCPRSGDDTMACDEWTGVLGSLPLPECPLPPMPTETDRLNALEHRLDQLEEAFDTIIAAVVHSSIELTEGRK